MEKYMTRTEIDEARVTKLVADRLERLGYRPDEYRWSNGGSPIIAPTTKAALITNLRRNHPPMALEAISVDRMFKALAQQSGSVGSTVAAMANGSRPITPSEPTVDMYASTAALNARTYAPYGSDGDEERAFYRKAAAVAENLQWVKRGQDLVTVNVAAVADTLAQTVKPGRSDIEAARQQRVHNQAGPAPTAIIDVVTAASTARRARS
jgi:hypothetical protein